MTMAKSGLSAIFPQIAKDIEKERREQEEWKAKEATSVSKNISEDPKKKKKKETKPAEPQDPGVRQDIDPPVRHKLPQGSGEGVMARQPTANGFPGKRSKSLQVPEDRMSSGKGKLSALKGLPERVSLTAPDRQPKPEAHVIRKSRSTTGLQSLPEHLNSLWNLDMAPDPVDVEKLHTTMRSEYKTGKNFDVFFRQDGIRSDQQAPTKKGGSRECLEGSAMDIEVRERWRVELTGPAMGQIRSIRGMCFTDSGDLAISEPENARVQIFSTADGKPQRVLTDDSSGRRMSPSGLCSVAGRSLLVAADLNRIVFLDPGFRDRWSSAVPLPGKTALTGLACTLRGDLVLTDTGVRPSAGLYETDGRVIREFKTIDWKKPMYTTVSYELGITFVSDGDAGCVYMFDQDGRLLNRLGRTNSDGSSRLVYPHGLCCLSRGTLVLVADRANLSVLVYDLRNRAVDRLSGVREGPYSPVCLASRGDRYLAVSDEIHDLKVDDYKLRMFRTKM